MSNVQKPLAVSVCVHGTKLPSMLIYNETQKDQIANKEFPYFSPGCKYYFQENARMDDCAMIEWVENILKSYIEMAPENIIQLLVLGSYQCHMITLVVEAIQQLSVEVEYIPGGYTSLCLPIDVRINKALKTVFCKDQGD